MMAKRTLCSRTSVLVFGALMLVAAPSWAQWSLLKTFPSFIESVYFLDQQGTATTGFVGLENSTIWRTTDNGATWNQTTTPGTPVPMEVTGFTFRNTLQGWCSIEDFFDGNNGAIWETTDGGQTWNSVYSTTGSVVSVGFCAASNELIASCWNINSISSTDFGVTWTRFAPSYQNGVTFSGSLGFVGVFSTTLNALYTIDGGVTWDDAPSIDAETWSPYAIPGTSMFVAAGEKKNQFFLSTNGGQLWTNPYTFTPIPTGCIMGTAGNLFVQTTDSGFYASADSGAVWVSICGPSNYRDTRFYSVGSQIFAGDASASGNLWYIPNASGVVALYLDKTNINFTGTRCLTVDSVIHITSITGCTHGVLTDAQILSGAPYFSLEGAPTTLTGNDSIFVLYSPSPSLKDSGKLLLEFNLGSRMIDTIITLYGTAPDAEVNFSIEPYLEITSPYACITKDSAIILRNLACDSLTLTRVSVSDSSHFHVLPLPLPVTLGPAGSDTIPIQSSSQINGTFLSELRLRMLAGGSETVNDSVPLTLKVLRGGQAEIGAVNLTVLDACTSIDTEISISATPCDSIVLLSAMLSDTSIFQLQSIPFPNVIPPSGTVTMHLHVEPGNQGTHTTQLHLRFVTGSVIVDTLLIPTLQVLYNIPTTVGLQDTLVEMGGVNVPCSSASRWVTFSNTLCKNLTIKNITWENADSEFWFDPAPFPITLPRDSGIDSILVHFKPTTTDSGSNRLRITLELGGVMVDTTITIAGVGISTFHDSLLTPMLSYGNILACKSDTLEGKIVNLSCDSVIAISANLAVGINFSVLDPAFPIKLAPGDTLTVRFTLQPEQNADVSDSALVTILDPVDRKDHYQTISLTGYIVPNAHQLALSSAAFAFDTIAPCSFIDSTIVITNMGNCDDVIITDTSLAGYAGVTLTLSGSLPIIIPADSSVRMGFRVVPSEDTLVSTQLVIRGQNIDTTVAFSYASRISQHALAFSTPDSIFTTKPCVPVTKTYWIANVGCAPTSVDSISLNVPLTETQFTLGGILGFPATLAPGDTLYYTVQFDPNGSGTGVALLNVNARQIPYARSIQLSGVVHGTVPTARMTLEANDLTSQSSGFAGDTTNVLAVLLDDIGDTMNLQTVTFTLDANWNLLTLTGIVPAVGWSIADTSWQNNGSLEIRLRHNMIGAVPDGTELVSCYFAIAVADSAGCDITMSGLRFNDTSANYDDCVLSPIEQVGTVRFTMTDTCGTPMLRSLLDGQLALEIISVRPNPVSSANGVATIDLSFSVGQAGVVQFSLSDMLGRTLWHSSIPCSAGVQTLPLALPNIPEGSYFMEVSSAGMKDSRKVVFESGYGKN